MGTFIDDNAGAQPSAPGELRATATEVTDASAGAVETTVEDFDSHLDSFFESSNWTREDVMVVAALLQIIAWASLLWLEVRG